MAAGAARSDQGPALDPVDGGAAEAPSTVGVLRLTGGAPGTRTYLRVGADVFPVYGDDIRGWSTRPDDFRDFRACSPFVYASLDELFFALVNLCAGPRGDA